MTPEAQNIAIAEACGWTGIGLSSEYTVGLSIDCTVGYEPGESDLLYWRKRQIPSYIDNLNDMHNAEKMIEGRVHWNKYTDELGKLRHYTPEKHSVRSFVNIIVHATAAERGEAFLRALDKWKD